jgi:hypothetical protein
LTDLKPLPGITGGTADIGDKTVVAQGFLRENLRFIDYFAVEEQGIER